MEYSIYVLLIPMVMFLFLGLFQGQLKGRSAGLIGTAGLAVTTVLAYWAAFDYFFVDGKGADGVYQKITEYNWVWLRFTENLHIDLGVLLDPISCMMLVVITTVSLMVHLYSLGYMKGERGFARYYAFLSLFSFSMLGLVVATNIFQMYIFWELVGVSSYLLIGFYYTRPAAIAASKKAFIVTDTFLYQMWKAYYNSIGSATVGTGSKDPISYYVNTARLGSALAYVEPATKSVVVNANKWIDSNNVAANGAFIAQMTFVTDGNSGNVSNGSQVFPIWIWFDEKF